MTITWGDPIPVIDGKRPDNPDYAEQQWRFAVNDPDNALLEVNLHKRGDSHCFTIRLPADHPLYAKPERQEQPADPLRERMEPVIRSAVKRFFAVIEAHLAKQDALKVHPDVLLVRQEFVKAWNKMGNKIMADRAQAGDLDTTTPFIAALSCLRLGREQGW